MIFLFVIIAIGTSELVKNLEKSNHVGTLLLKRELLKFRNAKWFKNIIFAQIKAALLAEEKLDSIYPTTNHVVL